MDEPSFEVSDDAQCALALLQDQGSVTVAQLRAAGVSMPAQAFYALQLAGWPVRRSGPSWRLGAQDEQPSPRQQAPPRVRRVSRGDRRP